MQNDANTESGIDRLKLNGRKFTIDLVLFVPRLVALPVMLTVAAVKLGLYDPLFGTQTY